MSANIYFDFGSLSKSLQLIIDGRGELPQPHEVSRTEGTNVGVTAAFRDEVEASARRLSVLVKAIGAELTNTQDAFRKTIEDMVEADASLADEARVILAALDDIASSSVPPSAPHVSPSAAELPAAPVVTRTW